MSTSTRDKLLDHEYDGIVEYDNPTPAWWHALFLASIVFSALYFAFFEFSPIAPTIHDRWRASQVAEFKRIFGAIGELKPDEPTILAMMEKPDMMAVAQGIFEGNCVACHAKDGGGGVGVNLTDDHYKNITKLTDFLNVLAKGAGNGAMPAWENRLSLNERIITAAYLATLRGTKPSNPKGPEGEIIAPWPKPADLPGEGRN